MSDDAPTRRANTIVKRREPLSLSAVRHRQILDLLQETSEVHVARLAEELQVSEMTIRRDLKLLEESGRLKRVHGGAVSMAAALPVSLVDRADLNRQAKEAIARQAVTMVETDSHVLITSSSTTLVLAQHLVDGPRAHYVTNSIDMALLLGAPGHHDVVLTGGFVRPSTRTLIGTDMLRPIESRVFDLCFLGVSAIDLDHGLLGPTEWHAYAQQVVRRQCRRVVALADHSKFGTLSNFHVAGFGDIDALITDLAPPPEFLNRLRDAGATVIWPGQTGG